MPPANSDTTDLDAVALTKADPNRSMREDALVAKIEMLQREITTLRVMAKAMVLVSERIKEECA